MSKRLVVLLVVGALGFALLLMAQSQGPQREPTGTVVPKKKAETPAEPQNPTAGPKPEVGETVMVPRRPPQTVKAT